MNINKDSIILLTEGEYDSHCVSGLFIALVDFNYLDVKKSFQAEFKERCKKHIYLIHYDFIEFTEYLIRFEYVKKVNHITIHLGESIFD